MTALHDLFAACQLADGHAPVGEHTYLSLLSGETESSLAFVEEGDDGIIGYLHLLADRSDDGWTFETAVHPAHRTDERLTHHAETAMEVARARGGATLRAWLYGATWPTSLAALGFRPERELRQMRVLLPLAPPEYPPQLTITSFEEGRDEQEWLTLNNAAFAGHPENGSWDLEILSDRQAQPWWDPEGVVMAREAGRLVGFCWTKDHGDGLGEIYIIAVDPEQRRRGLGRALTLDGLARLHQRGCGRGMLYVDAANRGALALYESLGFTLHHVDVAMIVQV